MNSTSAAEYAYRPQHARELLCFLMIYGLVMMTFAAIARGWGPLHADMTEAWAWGKEFQLGYGKHPPISGWIVGAWFGVMPRTNWSFYLLSVLNAGIGLAGVWMLAGLLLTGNGRSAVVIFLVLTPSYTLWALKFNANSVLLSSWPWTAYLFLQSLRTRSVAFGLLAGLAGAIAVLSKYYSIILIGTLFVLLLLHPERDRYLRSPAPYVAAAVGLAAIAPHAWWLWKTNFPTLNYAIAKTQYPTSETREYAVTAVVEGYLCLGIGAVAFALAFGRQSWALLKRALKATFLPSVAWLVWLAHGPLLLTLAAYFVSNLRITAAHLIPAFFAMPVAFLASSGALPTSAIVKRLRMGAATVWFLILVGSPWLATHTFARASTENTEPRQEIALEATSIWHALFARPLRLVGGSDAVATAVTFYSPDVPSYLILDNPSQSPWATEDLVKEEGALIICRVADPYCIQRAEQFVGERPFRHVRALSTSFWGRVSAPQLFAMFVLPPADMDFLD
jgi:4-amino-4-deoxy-L-arabinose transferase-like glycosyltransferase